MIDNPDIQTQLQALLTELQQLHTEFQQGHAHLDRLQQRARSLQAERTTMQCQAEALEAERRALLAQSDDIDTERLHQQSDALRLAHQRAAEYAQSVEAMQPEISRLQVTLSPLVERISGHKTRIVQLYADTLLKEAAASIAPRLKAAWAAKWALGLGAFFNTAISSADGETLLLGEFNQFLKAAIAALPDQEEEPASSFVAPLKGFSLAGFVPLTPAAVHKLRPFLASQEIRS